MSDLDTTNMPWNTPTARANLINVPESMGPLTLKSFAARQSIPAGVRVWLSEFDKPVIERRSLVLYGKPGRGKTGLGIAILRYLASLGIGDRFEWNLSTGPELLKKVAAGEVEQEPSPVWFMRWQRLLAQERRQKLDTDGWFDKLDEFVTVLMLDDVGVEAGTKFREGLLLQHMEWAEDKRGRSLILTLNNPLALWPATFGERIADRLTEERRFMMVEVTGDNLRD